jgi:hypothetical protein
MDLLVFREVWLRNDISLNFRNRCGVENIDITDNFSVGSAAA